MTCPACRQRKARRACPSLRQTICTVCCATKRLVEIDCPPDCVHLTAAREHPAAVVKRQQERDVAALLPTIQHLTERQHQLFFVFHSVIARHTPDTLTRVTDVDVAEAAATVAATLETSARGIIYTHTAPSAVAQRLVADLTRALDEIREHGATIYDGEAAIALRAIEAGARALRGAADDQTGYLALVQRLLQINRAATREVSPEGRSSAIVLP